MAPSVEAQTTCWKPRGGAQSDSPGSARLLGAAAPALSQGLSCSRSTTRNCNPSQSQHPEQSHLQSVPHLLRLSAGGCTAIECETMRCSALSIEDFNFIFIQRLCLEQCDKHRQANYLWNLWVTCFCGNRRFPEIQKVCVVADDCICDWGLVSVKKKEKRKACFLALLHWLISAWVISVFSFYQFS